MSTVATMIENAERLSKDRAVAQNIAQAPRKQLNDQAGDGQEAKKAEVNSEAVFRQ